jgi:hypothetical protein
MQQLQLFYWQDMHLALALAIELHRQPSRYGPDQGTAGSGVGGERQGETQQQQFLYSQHMQLAQASQGHQTGRGTAGKGVQGGRQGEMQQKWSYSVSNLCTGQASRYGHMVNIAAAATRGSCSALATVCKES